MKRIGFRSSEMFTTREVAATPRGAQIIVDQFAKNLQRVLNARAKNGNPAGEYVFSIDFLIHDDAGTKVPAEEES